METDTRIQAHELEYETRLYLRNAVSDTRKGRLSGNSRGGPKMAGLDGILDGSRRRPSTWPALVDPNEVLQEVAA